MPHGIRRIITERIKDSLKVLHSKTGFQDEAVHTIRRELKEARAALRLVRYDVGDNLFRQEDATIRDAIRFLSEARDAAVTIQTLDRLLRHSAGKGFQKNFKPLRAALAERKNRIRRSALGPQHTIKRAETNLQEALARAERLPIRHKGWKAVKPGLRKSYEQGRKAMADALHDGSAEAMHEWRKRIEYQQDQLEILRNSCKKEMGLLVRQAHTLADVLGANHDLFVLKQLMDGELGHVLGKKQRETLLGLLAKRQKTLQKKAAKLGQPLCAERGKRFIARVHGYWQAWR